MNVGFHIKLKQNEKQSFNEQKKQKNILNHVISLFNTSQFKYVLFVNSNVWVLLKLIRKFIFNNTVQHSWTLKYLFNEHVLLVLLKIL